ncbi:hypothetical protein [Rhodopirellula bahusiensis]|uniref:Uncharacterized protein n=1 Tax=Rhodopirellula bahusiensis TaxID=2014065 RepID=A0A2G1VY83_9BACT|nr:hypothetical protein [Rhodopirellula bahusiensis]PHQ31743.1 hypothetical protein CEE69_29315 [Rhodopirellula bahusiensis]
MMQANRMNSIKVSRLLAHSSILLIPLSAALFWWEGYSFLQTLVGAAAITASFCAMEYAGKIIQKWTGRSSARNPQSDAVYYIICFSVLIPFSRFSTEAGISLFTLAFASVMTIGRIAGQLLFGEHESSSKLVD